MSLTEFALGVITVLFGSGSALAMWLQGRYRGTAADRVPTKNTPAGVLTQAPPGADLPEAWSVFTDDLQDEMRTIRAELSDLRRARELDSQKITLLYGYSHQLRTELLVAGLSPSAWPPAIDPGREFHIGPKGPEKEQ